MTVIAAVADAKSSVVLLHSSASSARQWDALVDALELRFHVHAVELYGHGDRPDWDGGGAFSLADEVAHVVPLLERAGGAHIVGHSYGGAIALKLASLYPSLVRSVVAYEPVLFRWLSGEDLQPIVAVAKAMHDRFERGDAREAARRFVEFWSGDGAWASMSNRKQQSITARAACVLRHFGALFREPFRAEDLRRIGHPMLLMFGARTLTPMLHLAQRLRHALPEARHEVLARMGHMGPITHAAEVNRSIIDFLNSRHAIDPDRQHDRRGGLDHAFELADLVQ